MPNKNTKAVRAQLKEARVINRKAGRKVITSVEVQRPVSNYHTATRMAQRSIPSHFVNHQIPV